MKKAQGRNGGTLNLMEVGDKAPAGAGRPKNPFKAAIREVGEADGAFVEMWAEMQENGQFSGKMVLVRVKMPAVRSVVETMFRKAQKGHVDAAKWLSETGYGKTLKLGDDDESPLGGGFAVILPDNGR